jgi:hypothetical protein
MRGDFLLFKIPLMVLNRDGYIYMGIKKVILFIALAVPLSVLVSFFNPFSPRALAAQRERTKRRSESRLR